MAFKRSAVRSRRAGAGWGVIGAAVATAAHTIANTVESAFYIPACGMQTAAPFLYNITGMWCVRIVGAMICIRFLEMGLVSAWACMIAHNMLLFCLYLVTFIRASWNPLNVEQKNK